MSIAFRLFYYFFIFFNIFKLFTFLFPVNIQTFSLFNPFFPFLSIVFRQPQFYSDYFKHQHYFSTLQHSPSLHQLYLAHAKAYCFCTPFNCPKRPSFEQVLKHGDRLLPAFCQSLASTKTIDNRQLTATRRSAAPLTPKPIVFARRSTVRSAAGASFEQVLKQ